MPLLMELADEFHLTTVEALEVCDRLGIDVEDLLSPVSDSDVASFRRAVQSGALDAPDEPAAAPEPPSLAKAMGISAAAPSPAALPPGPLAPPPPGAPPASPPKAPRPSLRDRLPAPIADNLVAVVVCSVALVGLVAYAIVSLSSSSEPPVDPDELGFETAASLTIDDCIDLPEGAELADLPELTSVRSPACVEPHDIELYAEVRTYQGKIMEKQDEYPGTEALLADNLSECIARYEKFVGTPYRDSTYDVIAVAPTEEMWSDSSERVTLCGLTSTDGSKLEGSVKGAAG